MVNFSADNLPYEKVGKNEPVCIADEIPFEIPDTWEWVRLGSLLSVISDGTHKTPHYVSEGVPFLSVQNISSGKFDFTKIKYITQEEHQKLIERIKPQKDDILVCRIGTLGKAIKCTLDFEFSIFVSLGLLRPVNASLADYLVFAINSPLGDRWIQDNKVGGGTHTYKINLVDIPRMLIPIPPLEEQKRIFDKLSVFEPLFVEYATKENALYTLNSSFSNLLKKSILQEAVQGKLIPQDENDEPASVLLERIRAEKQALVKAGKIKKDKNESVIFRRDNSHYEKLNGIERCIDDEIPFDIPENWCWCRLGSILTKLSDGTHSTPKYVSAGVPFISVKDVSSGNLNFDNCKFITPEEHNELYSRCNPEYGDILLTKVGTTGIPVIVNTCEQFSLFVSVALLKFNQEFVYNEYLIHLINSPLVQKQAEENTRGVGNKNWVMRDISNTLIALPPLSEQHHIVAAYNSLLPFIEQL